MLYRFPKVLMEKVSDLASNSVASGANSVVLGWFYISLPIILIRKPSVVIAITRIIGLTLRYQLQPAYPRFIGTTLPFSKSPAILFISSKTLYGIYGGTDTCDRYMKPRIWMVHVTPLSQRISSSSACLVILTRGATILN